VLKWTIVQNLCTCVHRIVETWIHCSRCLEGERSFTLFEPDRYRIYPQTLTQFPMRAWSAPGSHLPPSFGTIGSVTDASTDDDYVPEIPGNIEPPIAFLSNPALCPIASLPYELVFEITSWVAHPADILSLALINRYFLSILLPPRGARTRQSDATWRHARQRMHFIVLQNTISAQGITTIIGNKHDRRTTGLVGWSPQPIPKPYEGMGEDTLMVILWGPKVCMICKKTFNETPKILGLNYFTCRRCDS
jgi:hypothetical protein